MIEQEFETPGDALLHFGVKGMKWGVVKSTAAGARAGAQDLAVKGYVKGVSAYNSKPAKRIRDANFENKVHTPQVQQKIYNSGMKSYREKDVRAINAKPQYKGAKLYLPALKKEKRELKKQYHNDHQDALLKRLNEAADALGTNASGTRKYKVDDSRSRNLQVFRYSTTEIQHADQIVEFRVLTNSDGEITGAQLDPASIQADSMMQSDDQFIAEFIEHVGVKGMKWGQRKTMTPAALVGVPKSTVKAAKKDAEEFTRAKLFYGEGAGTRRKLIKAKVEQNKKHDSAYARAFDHHVGQTDLAKRAEQARKERKSVDRKTATKKTARGVGHVLKGNNQYANNTAIVGVAAATYAHKTGLDKQAVNKVKTNPAVQNLLKKHGLA